MKPLLHFAALLLFAAAPLSSQEVEVVEMRPSPGIELAQFHFVKLSPNPAGLLVLTPGHNGSPEGLISDTKWRDLAAKHRFDIVGCYFKGDPKAQGLTYQIPAEGSGRLLTDAIRKAYNKDLPLALYGFSAGAQFTARFIALHPRRIKAWGAYAAGSVDRITPGTALPPGVLACGQVDSERHGRLRSFFNEGRAQGYRWSWVSVPNSGHTTAPAAVEFIQAFMDPLLSASSTPSGVWINLQNGEEKTGVTRKNDFGWLPDHKLIQPWKTAVGKDH